MELEDAKIKIKSLYGLIENFADEGKIGKGIPSRIVLDEHKIIMAEPQVINLSATPLLAEFLEKHQQLWQELCAQKWSLADANELVNYEHQLWDQHFG
jgi:hypothetical protein